MNGEWYGQNNIFFYIKNIIFVNNIMTKGGNCGCSMNKYTGGKKYKKRTMKRHSRKYRGGNDLMNQTNEQLGKWKNYLSSGLSNLYTKAKNTITPSSSMSSTPSYTPSNIGGKRKRKTRKYRKY